MTADSPWRDPQRRTQAAAGIEAARRMNRVEIDRLRAEVAQLKQTMWEAYAILGFDTDGDETYEARVGWPDGFSSACMEFRTDYDEALRHVEIP